MRPRLHHVLVFTIAVLLVTAFSLPVIMLYNWSNVQEVDGSSGDSDVGSDIVSPSVAFHSGRFLEEDTLTLAKADPKSAYTSVEAHGASMIDLDDGNTYGVWWEPEGFDPAHDVVLVSLGGHAGWATKDFDVWYPEIVDRGYAFFSLQYWLGRTNVSSGYYEPEEMYAMIRQVLIEKGVTPGHVIFQGYSMGSARSYGITALDHVNDQFFALTISNAGVWEDDYPINAKIMSGDFGETPFAGIHWMLYAVADDQEHPEWNGYEAMNETKEKIDQYGGTVDLYIQDDDGSHGSFMIDRSNVRQALDVADTIVMGS